MCPMKAIAVSVEEKQNRMICAISITTRRSKMSAIAPAGSDSSMIGKVVDACTRATMLGEGASEVISHEAPTASINPPKLEIRLAVQMEANVREWKGASVAESRQRSGSRENRRERVLTEAKILGQGSSVG